MADSTKGIAGHEGAGVVVAVGDGMDRKWKVGDRAGVKVNFSLIAVLIRSSHRHPSGLRTFAANASSAPTDKMNCTVLSRLTRASPLQALSSSTALLAGNTQRVFLKASRMRRPGL